MAISYNNGIVTASLIFFIDAANPKSYTGSSTVYNLMGNYNATITGTVTVSGGVFQFSGAGNYVAATGINLTSTTYTVMGASRYNGATRGRIINSTGNNWLMGNWNSSTENHYAEGWVSGVTSGANDTNWRIYAASGCPVRDSWQMYVNGTLTYDNANGSQGPNGLGINSNGNEPSIGECGFVLAYNRLLTSDEIKQNFYAFRGRYGL